MGQNPGMNPHDRLIAALRKRQVESGATDAWWAEHLGLSRQTWAVIRRGEQQLTLPTIRSILAIYPEYGPLATALLFLADDAKNVCVEDKTVDEVPG